MRVSSRRPTCAVRSGFVELPIAELQGRFREYVPEQEHNPEVASEKIVKDLIADFHSRVEELKRDGVPDFPPLGGRLPWAEASEERKLKNIVWESMTVGPHDGDQSITTVPGSVTLDVIENNVDYAKLPEGQREALQSLRGSPPDGGHDPIAGELQRLAGLELDDDEREIDGPTFQELAAEIQADTQAARIRDYGEADAATYEQRVSQGAAMEQPPDYQTMLDDDARRAPQQPESEGPER